MSSVLHRYLCFGVNRVCSVSKEHTEKQKLRPDQNGASLRLCSGLWGRSKSVTAPYKSLSSLCLFALPNLSRLNNGFQLRIACKLPLKLLFLTAKPVLLPRYLKIKDSNNASGGASAVRIGNLIIGVTDATVQR